MAYCGTDGRGSIAKLLETIIDHGRIEVTGKRQSMGS